MKNYEFSEKPSRQPEYRVNRDGDVKFERVGDEIVFGKTKNTRRVDAFPLENYEDYELGYRRQMVTHIIYPKEY